jgi:2-polyprenyl-3-methyl-5-hydroxy-6-metoxy-1,4-benzoquinol methylase
MPSIYEHRYEPISIYGNVVTLLPECGSRSGVHLDFGCGYGAIAEPIRDELGRAYIGFDIAPDGLESLHQRGFEAHRIDLYDLDGAKTLVERAIGNRPVASITCLDTLEHITNGEEVLKLFRCVAEPTDVPLVLSVPNVTHKDLALKLLIGRWDVTEAGCSTTLM